MMSMVVNDHFRQRYVKKFKQKINFIQKLKKNTEWPYRHSVFFVQ